MTKTTQYKNTSIGPIPTDWEVKEFFSFTNLSKEKYTPNVNEDYRCLELEHFEQETGTINGWVNSSNQKSTKNKFRKGDVLFGKLRPYLRKFWLAEFDGVCSSEVWVLNSNQQFCSNEFLFRLMQTDSFISVSNISSGSKMPRADWSYVSQFPFPLPPLPEQQKIAEVLSTWDKAIQETDAIIKKLEARNKALANKLFEENNWQINKLSDLFERITDKNKEGNTTVTTISAKHGFILQEDFFNKTVASKDLSNYYLINKGDFCYNKSYSKDYDWGVVKRLNDFEKAVVTTLYICFRFKDTSQNSDFWELYFENKILDKGLSKVAQEGGRAHGLLNVTSGDFFGIKVKVPSLDEQNAIAEILNTANQEVKQYQQKLEALKLQKKGLMQQLLTGKVRTV
ncbi:restriction endonuclease subunit S [Empedobacter sp. GD03797]|uniref:restriction endonuclease subunit S n=1 Tax=Empedobacter sp. GD03797 TaxID=2975382 RepID=UPI00244773D9|nr:restriction endonuclease subunit S [Empedobacter sp. GD03797]MDH1884043.1 restriction endonuclease subunit S [Empedobacter sp. GD03797]